MQSVCVCVCVKGLKTVCEHLGFALVQSLSLQLVCVSSQNAVRQSVGGGRTAGFWCLLNTMQLSNQCCVISTVPRIHTHTLFRASKIGLYETNEQRTVQKTACLGNITHL